MPTGAPTVKPRVTLVSWSDYTAIYTQRRSRALELASSADPAGCFDGWRFAAHQELCSAAWTALSTANPTPDAAQLSASLSPPESLSAPPSTTSLSERQHHQHLLKHPGAEVADTATNRLAWALSELSRLGAEVELRERQSWNALTYRPMPERDAQTTELWAGWFSGNPWTGREAWDALFLSAVGRSFRAVAAARSLPDHVMERVIGDLREAFFFRMLGGGDGVPGWVELAVRVLETCAPGPVEAVATNLPSDGFGRVAQCASSRGGWSRTVRQVFPALPEQQARARAMVGQLTGSPDRLEALLDLHVVLRLAHTWSESGRVADSWRVVSQNRGRARGRLRAVLAGAGKDVLLDAVFQLDAPYARTLAALKRYAWAWAWQELASDFSFDIGRVVTRPCIEAAPELAPIDGAEADALRCWVLLVVLKGRLEHLERWVRTAGTGDRDSTWARLISDDLPVSLRDPRDGSKRAATYHRVRAELSASLPGMLDDNRPLLHEVASLSPGRKLRGKFETAIAGTWSNAVALPKSGFPTFVKNANLALHRLASIEEAPCPND